LFTVLVEGDDHDEPVADAVRATIDGHIVLDRAIAERGRYPAINVLRSVSRTMPNCNNADENGLVSRARTLIARYEDMADMIRLGAYRKGSDPDTDEAIAYHDALETYLTQAQDERTGLGESLRENRDHIHIFAFADGHRPPETLVAEALGVVRRPRTAAGAARSDGAAARAAARAGKAPPVRRAGQRARRH